MQQGNPHELRPLQAGRAAWLTPSRDLERGTVPTEYLHPYIADYEVECGFCARHTPHRNGYWVRTGAGQIALCGICCVGNFFPLDDVRAMRAGVARLEEGRKRQRVLGPLRTGIPAVRRELEFWIPLEGEVEQALSRLEHSTWNPYDGVSLRSAVTETGTIDRVQVEPFMDQGLWYERITLLGRTRAASALTMEDGSLAKADRKLKLIEGERAETVKLTDQVLRFMAKLRSEAMDCLTYGIERLETAKRFFRRENMEELNTWFRSEVSAGRIRVEWVDGEAGSLLFVVNEYTGNRDIPIPDLAHLPTREKLIEPLRQGVVGHSGAA